MANSSADSAACIMGEAKCCGTLEQRQAAAAAALAAQRSLFSESFTCNNCQASLTDIKPMDVRGMQGMRAAGVAHCGSCDHDTMVTDGYPEALALFSEFMQRERGAIAGKVRAPAYNTP